MASWERNRVGFPSVCRVKGHLPARMKNRFTVGTGVGSPVSSCRLNDLLNPSAPC